jgi:hypothetical protein
MGQKPSKSFSEVSIMEAVARKVEVEVVINPGAGVPCSSATSRFLGMDEQGRLALRIPVTAQDPPQKQPIGVGRDVGLLFAVGEYVFQADSTVLEHTSFPVTPVRREDALILRLPEHTQLLSKRVEPRFDIDPDRPVATRIWDWQQLAEGAEQGPRSGRLANWSASGFGVSTGGQLPMDIGDTVLVRVEQHRSSEYKLYQAVLKHLTRQSDGKWLAGFGHVNELRPGQATPLIEQLTRPDSDAGQPPNVSDSAEWS